MWPRHTDFWPWWFSAVCTAVQLTFNCCSLHRSLFPLGHSVFWTCWLRLAYEALFTGQWLSFIEEDPVNVGDPWLASADSHEGAGEQAYPGLAVLHRCTVPKKWWLWCVGCSSFLGLHRHTCFSVLGFLQYQWASEGLIVEELRQSSTYREKRFFGIYF